MPDARTFVTFPLALLLVLLGSMGGWPCGECRAQESPPRAIPRALHVGEQDLSAEELSSRAAELLVEIQKLDPGDGEATRALVNAIQREADVCTRAAEVLRRLETYENAHSRHAAQVEAARSATAENQRALDEVTPPTSISEDEFKRVESEEQGARIALDSEQKALAQAQEARNSRLDQQAKVNGEITDLQRTLDEVVTAQGVPELAPTERRRLDHLRRTLELSIATLTLERDQHDRLSSLDEWSVELAQVQLERARSALALGQRVLEVTRAVRQVELERAAEHARSEADAAEARQREAQRLESDQAMLAVVSLESLEKTLRALESQEKVWDAAVGNDLVSSERRRDRVRTRNQRVFDRLPRNAVLDSVRREFLLEQKAWLEDRRTAFEEWEHDLTARLTSVLSSAEQHRDELAIIEEEIEDARREGEIEFEGHGGLRSSSTLSAQWLEANQAFQTGTRAWGPEVEPQFRDGVRDRWNTAQRKIDQILHDRPKLLERIVDGSERSLEATAETRRLLDERSEYLDQLSFWLRETPPFDRTELQLAGREIDQWLSTIPGLPARTVERAVQRAGDGALFLGIALFVGALVLWLQRRVQAQADEADTRRVRDALARLNSLTAQLLGRNRRLIAMLVISAALTFGWLDGDPLAFAIFLGIASFAGWALVRALTATLLAPEGSYAIRCTPLTASRAAYLLHVGTAIVAVLCPIGWHFSSLGLERLSSLANLLLAFWGVVMGWWLVFRGDVLALLLPSSRKYRLASFARILLPFAWPVLILFLTGVLALHLLGYRHASVFYATRSLFCILFLMGLRLVYELVRAFVLRQFTDDEDAEDDEEPDEAEIERRRVLRRISMTVLVGAFLVLASCGVGSVLDLSLVDLRRLTEAVVVEARGDHRSTTVGHWLLGLGLLVLSVVFGRHLRDWLRLERAGMRKGSRFALATLSFYGVLAVGTIAASRFMGIYVEKLGWLLAPAGVALGFGLTEILSNFVSGIILFLERPVQVGDVISIGEVEGDVRGINMRSTIVRTRDGISIIIPNKKLITDDLINWSHGDPKTRLRVPISVAYGSDVALVKRVLIEVIQREGRILRRPRPEVDFRGFGESELQFLLLVWLATPDITVRRRVLSDLNSAVDAAFRRTGIEIPFPQRDIHIRTAPTEPRQEDDEE